MEHIENLLTQEAQSIEYYNQSQEDGLMMNFESDLQELIYPEISAPATIISIEKSTPSKKMK